MVQLRNGTWTFQDGTPATRTQRNPTVSFSGAGWKTVTLVATNEFGSSTSVQNFAVNISSQATNMGPFMESFEDSENLWPFHGENYDNNHTFFSLYTEGGFSNNACVMLNSGARNQLEPDRPHQRPGHR